LSPVLMGSISTKMAVSSCSLTEENVHYVISKGSMHVFGILSREQCIIC
jgi:hypothetical protein